MDASAWEAEFVAKELPAGKFAPLVRLRREQEAGPIETSLTFSGVFDSRDEAARAAQDQYSRLGGARSGS